MNNDLTPRLDYPCNIRCAPELKIAPVEKSIKPMKILPDLEELPTRTLRLKTVKIVKEAKPYAPITHPTNDLNVNEICLKYYSLVQYLAGRLALRLPSYISLDDLISSGIIGLIDACKKYDPGKNILFKTYAKIRICGAMFDELRSLDWVPNSVRRKIANMKKISEILTRELGRLPDDKEIAQKMNIPLARLDRRKGLLHIQIQSLSNVLPKNSDKELLYLLKDEKNINPIDAIANKELKSIIATAIGRLPLKQKTVLLLYYYEGLTMIEIGKKMGYTESHISQLHKKALLKLKNLLDRGEKKNYFS